MSARLAEHSLLQVQLSRCFEWIRGIPVLQQWILVGLITFLLWTAREYYEDRKTWRNVPEVGSSLLTRWLAPFKYIIMGNRMVQEGYEKHKGGVFRIKQFGKWNVFVTTPSMVDELRRYPDEVLNNMEAINEDLETEWTFGKPIAENPYHVGAIRDQLTRNIGQSFPDVTEEMAMAFDTYIPATTDDWFPAKLDTFMKIVCRTANRAFIGLPLCRNAEFLDINMKFTIDVFLGAKVLKLFPDFMKPFARRFLTTVSKRTAMGAKHLLPVIKERIQMLKEHGRHWDQYPEDLLSWLMDIAEGVEKEPEALSHRILAVNVAAIHTTSMSFTTALYYLAAHFDDYAELLREEVSEAIRKEGWTKVTMTKCRKLDSFVKEALRLHPLGSGSMQRKVMKDITLSDGTFVPKGVVIMSVALPMHRDSELYPDATTFDGFRFSDIRAETESEALKHQTVSLRPEYLLFGYGKHACPGRFFAINEIKAMLSHVLLNYDVKFAPEMGLKKGEIPKTINVEINTATNQSAIVLFKRRENAMSAF